MDRHTIIDALKQRLEPNASVFALWLEGADAHDRVDVYSDLDIWIDVADGAEDRIWTEVEAALTTLAPIDFRYEKDHPHPKIRQTFFHLNGTPEFLIIDVCLQSHTRVFWYTKGFEDEKVNIIFDKARVIQFRDMDEAAFQAQQAKRLEELQKTTRFFQTWLRKELRRSNFLEAFAYYQQWVLEPLVEALRMAHQPTKHDFGLKHISRDLPPSVLAQVEELYKIHSLAELEEKSRMANQLFEQTIEALKLQDH